MICARRQLLAMTAGAAGAVVAGCARGQARPPLGIQLYMLGDAPQKDLEGTLRQVRAIGYEQVELPGLYGRTALELRTALDRAGLACTSVHVPLLPQAPGGPSLYGDLNAVAADVRILGAGLVVAPIFPFPEGSAGQAGPGEGFAEFVRRLAAVMGPDHWRMLAEALNRKAAELKLRGLDLAYHNHNMEFVRFGDGTALDLLIARTDPELVGFEVDVGWAAAAGQDPAALIARLGRRVKALHLKDIRPTTQPNTSLRMDPTEVGSGALDWRSILAAAKAAGVRRLYVEQEPPYAHPRLESAAISYRFLTKALAG